MERKEFLKRGFGSLLGVTAIAPLLNACKNAAVDPIATTTGSSGSTNGSSLGDCRVTATETAGPFPTKVPVNFVRKDIRDDRTGVVMTMNITVKNARISCAALAGAIVDVWHCDKDGYYSEYGGSGMQSMNLGLATFDWRRFLGTFGGKPESTHEKKACI